MIREQSSMGDTPQFKSLGQFLRWHRLRLGLSQEALAEVLETSTRSIRRWEQDQALPREFVRERLCRLFGLTPDNWLKVHSCEEASAPATFPTTWYVPLPRNPFFTGREEILHALHTQLNSGEPTALSQSWAISGLGGIGKTQIALEYAYQYRHHYQTVFWISAASRETLLEGLATVADILHLPEKDTQNHHQLMHAVKRWLASHQQWLLILDNADDLTVIQGVVPTEQTGHLLLTTRAQAFGSLARCIEVETMGMAESALFLLQRAKLQTPGTFLDQSPPELVATAEAIAIEMDFLPLALDQAGAYIEEIGCSISTYLELYRTHRAELLQRRGHIPSDHPESVATTWSLNFQAIEQTHPAARELLRLCAFLEPDTIPEELFSEGMSALGPVLQSIAADKFKLNEAIEVLRKFSLIQRDPETRSLRIHRLVQAVLKDTLGKEEQKRWCERVVRATSLAFPQTVEFATWPRCRRFLPQAQACSQLIQEYTFGFTEATSLLFRTANYLREYALHEQAERLYRQAIQLQELEMARTLSDLAETYRQQSKHEQAESLYLRVLNIQEQIFGLEHSSLAKPLSELATSYRQQGKYEQAESLYLRALRIQEQVVGLEHPELVPLLEGLARLYRQQGRHEQAKLLYLRALRIQEQAVGLEHPDVVSLLDGLARLYNQQGKYEQAEPLYQRGLSIWEQAYGPDHPDTARWLNNMAHLYGAQGKYEQAESLLNRSLSIWHEVFGPDHPNLALPLTNLADFYREQGKYEQAGPLYQRALHIWERAVGTDHPSITHILNGLANLYSKQGIHQQAEALYQRSLLIRVHNLGEQHPDTAETLYDFAVFQETQGRHQQAAELYQRALAVQEKVLGAEHSATITTRTKYLTLLQMLKPSCDQIPS